MSRDVVVQIKELLEQFYAADNAMVETILNLTREVYTRADVRFIGLPRIARHSRKPPPIANAPIESLATSPAPASRNRSTTVAS